MSTPARAATAAAPAIAPTAIPPIAPLERDEDAAAAVDVVGTGLELVNVGAVLVEETVAIGVAVDDDDEVVLELLVDVALAVVDVGELRLAVPATYESGTDLVAQYIIESEAAVLSSVTQ